MRPDDPRTTAQSSGTHRIGRLFVTSHRRPVFQSEDARALFQKCRGVRPQEGTDFDKIAEDLNFITLWFFSAFLRRTAPTAGEDHKWCLLVAGLIRRLLAAFGVDGPLDHLNNAETVNSFYILGTLTDAPREDLYLRSKMAAEIGASEVPGETRAIRCAFRGLQMMMVRSEWGAKIAGRNKGAPRKAPPEEEYLVRALHELYADVTGDKRWNTTPVDIGIPGGPFVDFVKAVAAHIDDNLDAVEPPAPAALTKNLKALSTSPRRIGGRIRRVRKRLKGTNQ
jgi:hypothetical protein